jgi:diacylglycerol kinase family enzyme
MANAPVAPIVPFQPLGITNATAKSGASASVVDQAEKAQRVVEREHLRFKTKDVEKQFLNLFAQKRVCSQTLDVLGRLVAEKESELQQFNTSMEKDFSIKPDRNYRYSQVDTTLYEIIQPATVSTGNVDVASGAAATSPKPEERVVAKLTDKAEGDKFVRTAAARRLTTDELQYLHLLIREKQMEFASIERQLTSSFSISKDRNYRYDADGMTLYEQLVVPEGVVTPEEKGGGDKRGR